MGGLRNRTDGNGNSSLTANVFEFSVLDESVASQIQKVMDTGKAAKLTYRQTILHSPLERNTSYVITKAEQIAE
jgi:hypothetical protein